MPDGNNVDSTVIKLAEQYQACNVRSRALNEDRAQIRTNVDRLGIDPSAFAVALAMVRDKTPGERQDYSNSLTRVLAALDGRENDLFGEADVAARNKRAEKRAERAAKAATPREVQDDKSDTNPKSDPDKGGAGKKGRGKAKGAAADPSVASPPPGEQDAQETGDELIARVAAEENAKREQREGGAMLDDAIDKMKTGDNGENPEPLSQSAQAAAVRDKLGLH